MELKAPPTAKQHIAVVEIGAAQTNWEPQAAHLRQGLLDRLREAGIFQTVSDGAAGGPGAVVVTGRITELDKGNKALR